MRAHKRAAVVLLVGLLTGAGIPTVASASPCDPRYVWRSADAWTVSSFDWTSLSAASYDWYDVPDLNRWVASGGDKPQRRAFPVVDAAGLPNFAEAPSLAKNDLSRSYLVRADDGRLHQAQFASRLYALTDVHPISETQVRQQLAAVPIRESDADVFDSFPTRQARRDEVMRELRALVGSHFAHDSTNLQCALTEAASVPGATVGLSPGRFYLHQGVVTRNFRGRLTGAGRDATFLETIPGGMFPNPEPFAHHPAVLVFAEGDVLVTDLTLRARGLGELVTHGIIQGKHAGIYVTGRTTGVRDRERSAVNVAVERVRVMGEPNGGVPLGTNLVGAIRITGESIVKRDRFGGTWIEYAKPISGEFFIRSTEVDHSLNGLTSLAQLVDSTVVIGGKPADGNAAANCGDPIRNGPAVQLIDSSNTRFDVSHNTTTDCSAVYVEQGAIGRFGLDFGPTGIFPTPSRYVFEQNTVRQARGSIWAGFELWNLTDAVGVNAIEAVISGNDIDSPDHVAPFGAIFTASVHGAVISTNRVTGAGRAAIYIGPQGLGSDRGSILAANNLEGFDPIAAGVILGPRTSEISVVGHAGTNVIDLGTNNVLVGVNNMGNTSLGQDIAAAMQLKQEVTQERPR
jgi:hypothetical protein